MEALWFTIGFITGGFVGVIGLSILITGKER